MNYIKHIIKYLVVVLFLFFSIGITAQNNKVKGTRITESMTESEVSSTAILDLDSSERGFMMPRMSTTQRDQLVAKITADANEGLDTTGLVIYNTSNDCIEYWHGSSGKWRSLCGSLPPAKLDFIDGCGNNNIIPSSNMNVEGAGLPSWQQDRPLSPNIHTMTIRVYVSQAGTYTIHADSGNGYFFSAEGIFQAEGNYNVILKGRGTPKVGYNQSGTGKKGDKVIFTFNGETSKKCKEGIEFKIIPAFLKLTLENATFKTDGKYYVRANAKESAANKLDIRFQLEVPGHVKITAVNTELGLEFMGEKTYTSEDNLNQVLTLLPVAGKSIPTKNSEENYEFKLDINVREADLVGTINGAKATIAIEPTEVAIQHATINFGTKPFYEGSVLDASSEVIVPVKVVGSGNTKMTLTNTEGVQFVSEDMVFDLSTDVTKVIPVKFKAVANGNKMPKGASSVFTLEGSGRFVVSGDPKITFKLDKKPVGYTIDCAPGAIKSSKTTIIVDKPVGDGYYIIVPVTVTVPGEYELNTTSILDGKVSFSSTVNGKKAEFKAGDKFAYLYPTDASKAYVPKKEEIKSYPLEITNSDGNSEKLCKATFDVTVGWPELKVLYTSASIEMERPDRYFKEGNRFGEKGTLVKTGAVTVDMLPVSIAHGEAEYNNAQAKAMRKAIVDKIKSGEYNLILIDNQYALTGGYSQEIADALDYYVNNYKGFVIVPTAQGDRAGVKNDLISYLLEDRYGAGEPRTQIIEWIGKLNGKLISVDGKSTSDVDYGFVVPNDRITLSTHYPQPAGYGLYLLKDADTKINTNGGNFIPILRIRETDTGSVGSAFIHKTHNVIWMPMLSRTDYRTLYAPYVFDKNKEYDMAIPMITRDKNSKSAYTTFFGNLLVGIVTEIMNQ